jgi:prolyl oligopeptidase
MMTAARVVFVLVVSCAPDPAVPAVLRPPSAHVEPDAAAATAAAFAYPATRRDDVADVLHGVEVPDPYRWLEDGKSGEVRTWMREQDAYARRELEKLALRAALAARLTELARAEQQWAPRPYGGRLFYLRQDADRERAVVYVREGTGTERALLDPDAWSNDRSLSLGDWWPSWDGKKVVYQVSRRNADAASLRLIDVASGAISDVETIDGAEWPNVAWTPGSDGFFYQWVSPDPAIRAERFLRGEGRFHKLGEDPMHDATVRAPSPDQAGAPLTLDSQGRWLVANVEHGWGKSDVYFEDLRAPRPAWRTLVEGRDGRFSVEVYRGTFYVCSTDGAPHGELFAVNPEQPERSRWKRIVAERDNATLEGHQILGHHIVLRYLQNLATRTEIRELDGTLVRSLPGRIGNVSWLSGTPDGDDAFYEFDSYDHPREIYALSIKGGTERSWYRQSVRADVAQLVTDLVFYPSKDGTKVPLFLFHRKDMKLDGSAPTLLFGYGAANARERPNWSPLLVPWVERGGIYAFAGIRGGGEYGEGWHRAGSLRNKQNTFDDFIAAAEYLVRERYTRPDRLAARGGSWGGLLVAATLTQRPELFRAVLCLFPQTDMIRFPLTGLGTTQLAEFGDPQDPDDFRVLLSYSPYHHVARGARYPAVLVSAAETDERVDPMHARKFAAALQAGSTGGEVLLRVDWDSGHKGTGLATPEAEKRAEEYAFLFAAMGVVR